ncbi:Putative sodium-coupled neutral amino acid transporter 10 [Frankliniella fusca]|uniref:Sodium-coupled neutral amino acid transporter 10 n=1 Tax=Frankliniella fusca TaxID=407009 RepID=A0AAE1LKV1_9NEOP|nr:Putative sodium-coupled neutral amino acid transporter 10 [Frankliniella fusca]
MTSNMGTNTGQVMTLCNSIIGVSILAMPFCFKQCGIILSILLLCLSSILSRFACHFLLKSAVITRRRNYEFLAFHVFGSSGKLGVELAIIGFLLGTCIAFFVVMGDLGPDIFSSIMGLHRTDTLRTSILVGVALFVVLPLGLLRNVDSLSSICTATFAFYLCLVLKVMGEAAGPLINGTWLDDVNFWRPEGILQCSPIFSMALFCQTQLFEIFNTVPNVALDKLNSVVRVAINLCTAVYISVGFFGYVAFSKENITGNILVSLSENMSSEVIKLGFLLSIAVSFPLVIFPCRASLYSLLYRSAQPPVHDIGTSHVPESRFKLLTFGIVGISLLLGLMLPNIERVLGIIGSTIGVTICIITPSLLLGSTARHSNDRLLSQVILWSGAVIMVLGTYAHILNGQATGTDPGLEQAANRILDHAVDRLNDQQSREAILFNPLSNEEKVKNLLATPDRILKHKHPKSLEDLSNIAVNIEKSSLSKTVDIDQAASRISEKADSMSNVAAKPVRVDVKLQEPPIPAETGEKQQEPLEPVEAVAKPVSAQPIVPIIPAPVPSSESVVKESKVSKQKIKANDNLLKGKSGSAINAEEVNVDAIRHEDAESALEAREEKSKIVDKRLNDVEDRKKKAEEQKLIETLKEHQEVQRDMLNEQQRILKELKKHEQVHQQNLNEVVKDSFDKSQISENPSPKRIEDAQVQSVKEVHGDSILLVAPDKEAKQVLNLKERKVEEKKEVPLVSASEGKAPVLKEMKPRKAASIPIVPLPLVYSAKASSSVAPGKLAPEQIDSKPAARDILESEAHHLDREKRDIGVGETERVAGTGPDAANVGVGLQILAELKELKGDMLKECKPNEKNIKQHNPDSENLKSMSLSSSKNIIFKSLDGEKSTPSINVRDAANIHVEDENVGKIKGNLNIPQPKSRISQSVPLMELKTPSSISEPHVGMDTDMHDSQNFPDHRLPLTSSNEQREPVK